MRSLSSAGIFYGVWATNASLAFAAKAHVDWGGAIRALDMVHLRRPLGTLSVKHSRRGKGAVERIPEEV